MNTAYDVIIRRRSTGCDFRIRLFAKDAETAELRAKDRARFAFGIRKMDLANLEKQGIAVFRVISCDVSDDQSRPLCF
jgi:hypothetical protein